MIKILNLNNCCGCGACKSICPRQCIKMIPGEYGFLYPIVDESKCINCHLCEKACLYINKQKDIKFCSVYKCYALKHSKKNIRNLSASGGAFSVFAEYIINERKGGIYGASFDDKWNVNHIYVNNIEGLKKLRGSKYVQSDIGNTFNDCKKRLDNGETILYTGTPCQIRGLKLFLKNEYDNLFTIAIMCHSVSSPWVWNKYLKEISPNQDISYINFRYKKYSWEHYSFLIKDSTNKIIINEISTFNPFMRCIMRGDFQRLSCENCQSKGEFNMADAIIGDFWSIWKIDHNFYDRKGVSAVVLYNDRLLNVLKNAQIKEVGWNDIYQFNKLLLQSHISPKERMYSELKIKRQGVLNYCKSNKVDFKYKVITFKQILKRFLRINEQ